MEVYQKQYRRLDLLLVIYTSFSPSMIEIEIWGAGEHYALDAIVSRFVISSSFGLLNRLIQKHLVQYRIHYNYYFLTWDLFL